MNRMPTSVLIVDDHALVREGIRRILHEAKRFKVVGEGASGEEGVRLARELSPQVIIMDLKMPGIGGAEATRKILHFLPDTKILIVTAYLDTVHPSRLLHAGAAGYLTKDATGDELIHAIHSINSGQRYVSPSVAQKMVLNNVAEGSSPFGLLSNRELQVMTMVTRGIETLDIAKKLNLSAKTINTYRYRIFKKLNISSNDVALTHLALEYGMIEKN